MLLTKSQIKLIVDQEINKSLNENMDRRHFCKVAAGTAAFFSAGCQEYEFSHVTDDNTENMQLPECVQNCYFNDYDNPDAWPKEVGQFSQQFEGEKYIDATHTGNAAAFGFGAFEGIEALVVAFHNVPAESPSLEEVINMSDDDIGLYWSDERVLNTVEICFLIRDGMVYLNEYHYKGDDVWKNARPYFLIQGDDYHRRSDLKQCRDAYKAYLFGPIRPEQQETP